MIPSPTLDALRLCCADLTSSPSDPGNRMGGATKPRGLFEDHSLRAIFIDGWYFLSPREWWESVSGPSDFLCLTNADFWEPIDSLAGRKEGEFPVNTNVWGGPAGRVGNSTPLCWIAIQPHPCAPLPLLLTEWGAPPKRVSEDWYRQLLALRAGDPFLSPLVFLATQNGLLKPIEEASLLLLHASQKNLQGIYGKESEKIRFVQWPWEPEPSFARSEVATPLKHRGIEIAESKKVHANPKLSVSLWTSTVGGAGLFLIVVVGLALSLSSSHQAPREVATAKVATSKEEIRTPSLETTTKSSSTARRAAKAPTDFSSIVDTTGSNLIENEALPEDEVLSQQLTLSESITSESFLDPMSRVEPSTTELDTENATELEVSLDLMTRKAPSSEEPSELAQEPQPEKLATGIRREKGFAEGVETFSVGIGENVVTKKALCSAELSLPEAFLERCFVTPTSSQSLLGESRCEWTVAMTDENPHLLISLQSDPGRRWRFGSKVLVRLESGSPLHPLQPGDAKQVLQRLRVAKQQTLLALEQNQAIRDGLLPRGSVTPAEQRRILRRQDKEIDDAMEKWNQVEQLSAYVYEHATLKLVLSIEH